MPATPKPPQRTIPLREVQYETCSFLLDISVCPACGGPMKIVAALTDPASIRTYLQGVGLPARAPPVAPARPNPQHELEFAA